MSTASIKVAAPKFGRAAEVRAASFNEADNSVEVIWTTGASVRRRDFRSGTYYNEILEVTPEAVRLDRLNAGAPLLDTHDDFSLSSVIGSVIPGSARVEGGKGYARVALSPAPGDADVVAKIRGGIIRNISVGYSIHKVIREAKEDGADEDWRVVDWEPLEISAVPVPADAGSQIRTVQDQETVVEIVTVDTPSTFTDRRARMEARQRAMATTAPVVHREEPSERVFRAVTSLVEGGKMNRNFEAAMLAGRAAAEGQTDAMTASLDGWNRAWDLPGDCRGAASAVAFMLVALAT